MSHLLKKINSPQDLKKMSIFSLEALAGEIRRQLIEVVSRNGGHLAPSLGVVELTLALHYVFNSPDDKIIWDVGHQCYAHKIVTGRGEKFDTLRKLGGISGFPRREESPHDSFGTGHSSTSISAALGFALARDLSGEQHSVIAVIGDGALTGGLSFEALNHAGHLKKDLIVVLNDNEMSIARNVGALASYLSRLRTDPKYSKSKSEIERLLRMIPVVGSRVFEVGERLKDSVKYLVVPGMFFEELGFTYLGPIDGHNLLVLIGILKRARAIRGPVLVHVVTKKGKGYCLAEINSDKFHGVGPFDIDTGKVISKNKIPSYTEVFSRTMVELGQENDKIVAITAAMSSGTGLSLFARRFPQRFFDVGIAEGHAVTLAAGLAAGGFKPVVAIYSTFLQRAYDQVIHDVCIQNLPVVFVLDRSGIVGEDGATHHGLFDFSYLRFIPNMVIMAPKDENELQHMLKTALDCNGPCAIRYPKGNSTGSILDKRPIALQIGCAEVLREGKDVTLVGIGNMVQVADQAAQILEDYYIKSSVINARFVKPLDEDCLIGYALKTGYMFIIEENVLQGGFGSAVLELFEARNVKGVEIKRLGIPDTFVEHGNSAALRAQYGLNVEGLVRSVLAVFSKQRKIKNKVIL